MLPKVASKLPKISELRNMINYPESRKPLGPSFWKLLQAFREFFESPSGAHGSDFIKWKDEKHIHGLKRMVDAYLDNVGNGPKFWPDNPEAPEYNSLQYSVHREYIKSILVQIFWRLNHQQYTNDKYKRKHNTDDNDRQSGHGTTREQIGGGGPNMAPSSSTSQHTVSHIPGSSSTEPHFARASRLSTTASDLIDPSLSISGTGETEADPYLVPESPTFGPENDPSQINTGKDNPPTRSPFGAKAARPRIILKRTAPTATNTEQRPKGKKRRLNDDAPVYRNSPRQRKVRRPSFAASDGAVDEACMSPRTSAELQDPPPVGETTQSTSLSQQEFFPSEDFALPNDMQVEEDLNWLPWQSTAVPTEEAPETSIRDESRPLDPPEPTDTASHNWPPPPTIEDAPGSSRTITSNEASKLVVEASSSTTRDATLAVSRTASPSQHFVSGNQFHHFTPSFENNEPPPQSFQTQNFAPVALMEPTPMEVEGDISTGPNQATPSVEAQEEPLQNTGALEPKIHFPYEEVQSNQDISSLAKDHIEPECRVPPAPEPSQEETRGNEKGKQPVKQGADDDKSDKDAHQTPPPNKTPEEGKARTAKVEFSFILILSRFPRWRGQEWRPKGKFLKKTLPELKSELPHGFASEAPGLMFRLRGPGIRTEEPVPNGETDTFEIMTKCFQEDIKNAIRKSKGVEDLSFRIEIEGLRDDYLLKADEGAGETDEEDFLC